MRLVGATFQLGRRCTSPGSASKISANVDTGVEATKRPHISFKCKTARVRIDLHINQSLAPVDEIIACAVTADRDIYDSVWVLDHLATLRPHDADGDMVDPHVLLGAIAARTSRVNLGVLVNNMGFRNPAAVASATATLDALSHGRAVLGLGAGAAPGTFFAREHEVLGNSLEPSLTRRHDRLFDSLAKIHAIWAGTHDDGVRFAKPTRELRTVVGVNSVTLARRAADAGCGINVRADHPRLADIAACRNTSLPGWSASVWLPFEAELRNPDHPKLRTLRALGFERVMLLTTTRAHVNWSSP